MKLFGALASVRNRRFFFGPLTWAFCLLACSCERPQPSVIDSQVSQASVPVKPKRLLHDFGVVDNGDRLSAKVTVTNDTDKPMAFNSVRVSCGCLSVESYPKAIKPGESGTI